MSFTAATVPVSQGKPTGFSLRLRKTKAGETAFIYIGRGAQLAHFGKSIKGDQFAVMVGEGKDLGFVQIIKKIDGPVVANGMKTVAHLVVNKWNGLPNGTWEARSMPVVASEKGQFVTLRLPTWDIYADHAGDQKPAADPVRSKATPKPPTVTADDDGHQINLGGGKSVSVPRATAME